MRSFFGEARWQAAYGGARRLHNWKATLTILLQLRAGCGPVSWRGTIPFADPVILKKQGKLQVRSMGLAWADAYVPISWDMC
jgi:hypothetical protein